MQLGRKPLRVVFSGLKGRIEMGTADDFEFSEKITRKLVRDGLISRRILSTVLHWMSESASAGSKPRLMPSRKLLTPLGA